MFVVPLYVMCAGMSLPCSVVFDMLPENHNGCLLVSFQDAAAERACCKLLVSLRASTGVLRIFVVGVIIAAAAIVVVAVAAVSIIIAITISAAAVIRLLGFLCRCSGTLGFALRLWGFVTTWGFCLAKLINRNIRGLVFAFFLPLRVP